MMPCSPDHTLRIGVSLLLIIAFTAMLTGCCDVCPPAPEKLICPPTKHYTPEQEIAMGKEFKALQPDSLVKQLIIDYGVERKALNACRSE